MRHVRETLPGNPETGLQKIIVEQRGLRTFKRSVYADPRMTAMQAAFDGDSPMHDYDDLRQQADAVLEAAGEVTYLKALSQAQDATKDQAEITRAIHRWHSDISERRGHVSREATASRFLFTADLLCSSFDVPDDQWLMIFKLAKAWHDFSLDDSGAHERIVSAIDTQNNLAAGSDTRAQTKAKKLEAVRIICAEIWARSPASKGNLSRTAKHNFDAINAKLHTQGHEPSKTCDGLIKVLQAAFSRRGKAG